jgi:branched-chain amino acid transport system substrate-binding protein
MIKRGDLIMKRRNTLLALLMIMPLLLTACSERVLGLVKASNQSEPKCPIHIGIITSQTGRHAAGGEEHKLGYDMAADEINAKGGILGCQVELVYEDDKSEPYQAQLAVQKLVEQDKVPIIIGAYSSGATTPAAGVANAYKIPFMVPSASSDLITDQGYKWVFRINAPSSAYVSTALDFVEEKLGIATTVAIIYEDSFFGESASVVAAMGAVERELKVVAYEDYKAGSADYAQLLTRVKATNPDVIYFASGGLGDAVLLMQQCKELDLNPKLYLGHAGGFVNPNFLEDAGEYAEYFIATAQWAPDVEWQDADRQNAADFARKFRDRYGVTPGMRSAQTYTTLYVVKHAIELAGQSESLNWTDIRKARIAIHDALRKTDLEKTIFGPIQFDRTGQNAHPVLLIQVINGQFVTVYPQEYKFPDQDPIIPVPHWAERQSGK